MIDVETLVAQVAAYNPNSDADLIRKAYAYGKAMHEGQKRHSGEDYFTHPIEVAMILAAQRLDDASITTALLHDTLEDTKSTFAYLETEFGTEVAELVDGVTKLTNLELSTSQSKEAENFRKLLMAMSKDIRVLLVKLADRLHNMRTIKFMPEHKQAKKAQETMDVFAPLAGRMGMQWMREELEDHAFKILNPTARDSIIRRFVALKKESDDLIPRIIQDLSGVLERAGVQAKITGREKKPFSIWRKMEQKQLGFSRLSDIFGFRIITENDDDLYRALGVVHRRWTVVPGRFKDYASAPKPNGYRSIHTTVRGRDGKIVEIQIRTKQMHEVAEVGVAAHWAYRDGKREANPFIADPLAWLSSLTQRVDDEDGETFLEHVKLEMFPHQVFCFTPKGDVVNLPRGATPLDFAYAIHTRIGSSCIGAKVDGHRVPLWTKLRNGQSVEIQTAIGQRPQGSWLELATTGRARSAIRRSLREESKAGFEKLGQQLARVALEQVGKKATDRALDTAAKKLGMGDRNEVLQKLGAAEISGRDLVEALYPALLGDDTGRGDGPVAEIVGLEDGQVVKPATCCQPLPGERIVGIAMQGHGVEVHSIYCESLIKYESATDRWIDLRWTEGSNDQFNVVTIDVTMAHSKGVLGKVCTLISEQGSNIVDIDFNNKRQDFYQISIDLEVRDVAQLTNVVTALEADSDVAEVIQTRRQAQATK